MAITVTQENFESEVLKSKLPIVVDVYASWCGPCQQMEPIVEELEKELKGTVSFAKLNVDEARDLAIKFGVSSVPTFIFVHNGTIKAKDIGYMDKATFKEKINANFGLKI